MSRGRWAIKGRSGDRGRSGLEGGLRDECSMGIGDYGWVRIRRDDISGICYSKRDCISCFAGMLVLLLAGALVKWAIASG